MELLIASSIMVVALIGIYIAFDTTMATYSRGQGRAEVQQNGRVAMDQMARQIRMAGYFPENFATPPAAPPLANPLHVATNNAFAIYGDADGSFQSGTAPFSNLFLFCLSQDLSVPNQPVYRLWRVRSSAPFAAAAYTCPAGPLPAPANATVLAEFPDLIGTTLSFTYYDAFGTLLPAPLDGQVLGAVPSFANTTNRAAVRRVLITLSARRDVPGHEPQTYMLTSDVRLRNLCLSC